MKTFMRVFNLIVLESYGKSVSLQPLCISLPWSVLKGITMTVKLYAVSKILSGKYTALFIKLFPYFS
jgi:hypothetical protein